MTSSDSGPTPATAAPTATIPLRRPTSRHGGQRDQSPYGQSPYGAPPEPDQPQYRQSPYGQPQYGQQPYGQQPYGATPGYGYPGQAPVNHPSATTALVLSIIGLVGIASAAASRWCSRPSPGGWAPGQCARSTRTRGRSAAATRPTRARSWASSAPSCWSLGVLAISWPSRGGPGRRPASGTSPLLSAAAADQHRLVDQADAEARSTPSRTSRARASRSAVVAPPRLVSARVCLVDTPAAAGCRSPCRSRPARSARRRSSSPSRRAAARPGAPSGTASAGDDRVGEERPGAPGVVVGGVEHHALAARAGRAPRSRTSAQRGPLAAARRRACGPARRTPPARRGRPAGTGRSPTSTTWRPGSALNRLCGSRTRSRRRRRCACRVSRGPSTRTDAIVSATSWP